MMEHLLPKRSAPPAHKHTWSDETFYILDGHLTFQIGDDLRTAGEGDSVMVPRETRHGFRVDSNTSRPQRLHAGEHGAADRRVGQDSAGARVAA